MQKLEEIGGRIAELRTGRGWTQEMFAEKLSIARNTLTKLEGGFRDFKTTELLNIAKVLGVSTDYLLGHTDISTPDVTVREVSECYGLSEAALNELSDMPSADVPFGAERDAAMSRRADTMAYRAVVNMLLSEPLGRKALKKLALYYFTSPDARTAEHLTSFVLPWDTGGSTWLQIETIDESLQRELLLRFAEKDLHALREERANRNNPEQKPNRHATTAQQSRSKPRL